MEKGRGKGTDTLAMDNDFVRRGDVKRLLENTVCLHEELPAQIDIIPAADVVPIRHGKWVGHDIGGRMSINNDACSECGSVFYQIAETGCVWHYCPNCGALMDKDGDGDV